MRDIRLWQVTGPSKTAAAAPRKHRTVQTLPDCTSTSLNLPGLSFKPIDPLDRSTRSTVIQGIALVLTWVHSCFSLAAAAFAALCCCSCHDCSSRCLCACCARWDMAIHWQWIFCFVPFNILTNMGEASAGC